MAFRFIKNVTWSQLYESNAKQINICSVLQGEMEQLTISKDSSAVSNQCSATRIPITTDTNHIYEMQGDDPSVLPASTRKDRKIEGN